jgi:tRNA(fMet)-specific endonuclease VapC
MRHISIDTHIYTAFKKGESRIIEIFQNVDTIGVDITVLAELLSGFKNGSREKLNRQELINFFNNSRIQLLSHTADTAEFYADIYSILKKKGTPIPTNDMWIAASAMQHGRSLLSLDAHFSKVEGLLLYKLD